MDGVGHDSHESPRSVCRRASRSCRLGDVCPGMVGLVVAVLEVRVKSLVQEVVLIRHAIMLFPAYATAPACCKSSD